MFENFRQDPKRYIKGLAMDLVVAIVSLAYIFYSMIKLEPQNLNPLILLAKSIVSIICGVMIKQSLGENGFSKGYNSKIWQEEEDKYSDACYKANPYMDRVENFYRCEEIEKRRNYRREHLQAAQLRYEDWFDFQGNYIGTPSSFKKLKLRQKLTVKKCVKVKIYVLNLFCEYGTASEQDTKKEETDSSRRRRNITNNTISAVVIAIIGEYFLAILSMDWAAVLAATLQVSLWVMFGILQLYKNYSFVVITKVDIRKKKKELIKKFITGCEAGLYQENPYDSLNKGEMIKSLPSIN